MSANLPLFGAERNDQGRDGAIAAVMTLDPSASRLEQMSASGLTGAAIYHALIGATARHAGPTLITRDLRAARAYDVVGAKYEYLEK